MSRMKTALAAILLLAITGVTQQAQATDKATIKLAVSGSSALWQVMGLATYNNGNCPTGAVKPCFHWTGTLSLTDKRPQTFGGGTAAVDGGGTWIVWDSHTTTSGTLVNHLPNVWVFTKVDSAVGDRCYFAHPRCFISGTVSGGGAGSISSALWGADTDPSTTVDGPAMSAAFAAAAGVVVGAAASDIRPEDALWATCRANSALSGNTLGLGYNSNIPAGQCPTSSTPKGDLQGADIVSEVKATNTAHVIAWNISGTDPYSGQTIPAFSTVNIGAEPVLFVASLAGGGSLNTVQNVTDAEVQQVFSGNNCNAQALGAGASDPLDVYLREPLSGTMNTIEYTAFAYPNFSGTSQETGVNPSVGGGNPLNSACGGGGGTRKRGIGTGDIINAIHDETGDAVGYAFFGYGNFTNGSKPVVDNSNFRYFTLNGADPIFHAYVATAGQTNKDPGQPNAFIGEIPGPADLPATCASGGAAFPCGENAIWNGGLSFPSLRSGQYRAWSVLRYVSDGANLSTAKTLLTAAQSFVASTIPEFLPWAPVAAKPANNPPVPADPGLQFVRSHYQQVDTNGVNLGAAPVNGNGGTLAADADKGGDVGGCILHATPGTTATDAAQTDPTTGLTQASHTGTAPGCVVFSTH